MKSFALVSLLAALLGGCAASPDRYSYYGSDRYDRSYGYHRYHDRDYDRYQPYGNDYQDSYRYRDHGA